MNAVTHSFCRTASVPLQLFSPKLEATFRWMVSPASDGSGVCFTTPRLNDPMYRPAAANPANSTFYAWRYHVVDPAFIVFQYQPTAAFLLMPIQFLSIFAEKIKYQRLLYHNNKQIC